MFRPCIDNAFKSTKIFPAHSLDSIQSNSSISTKQSQKSRMSATFGNILRPARVVGRAVKGPFEFRDCVRGLQKRTLSNGLMMCTIIVDIIFFHFITIYILVILFYDVMFYVGLHSRS